VKRTALRQIKDITSITRSREVAILGYDALIYLRKYEPTITENHRCFTQ